jgi:hypothetical protein
VLWVTLEDCKPVPVDIPLVRRVVVDGSRSRGAMRMTSQIHFATCPHRQG